MVERMAIGSEKYVAFTTYRKDGTAKATPVWIADLDDGTLGFTTPSTSWKVKRLANDHRVQLQPSDGRGKIKAGTEAVEGTAAVVEGADFDRVRAGIKAKYGYQLTLFTVFAKVSSLFGRNQHTSDRAVIVTLNS